MNLVALKNIDGVSKVIERAKNDSDLKNTFAAPGDVFSVKTESEGKRLIAKGAAKAFETPKPAKTTAKKTPAKKDSGEAADSDGLGLD